MCTACPTMRSPTSSASRWRRRKSGSTGVERSFGICSTTWTTGGRLVRCEEVAVLMPSTLDQDGPVALPVQHHIESCLRCQAELARYRRMLRGLQLLRTQFFEPAPGLLGQTLAVIGEAGEQ